MVSDRHPHILLQKMLCAKITDVRFRKGHSFYRNELNLLNYYLPISGCAPPVHFCMTALWFSHMSRKRSWFARAFGKDAFE